MVTNSGVPLKERKKTSDVINGVKITENNENVTENKC